MAVNLSPAGGVAAQFFTNTGAVLTGGKLYSYAAGTTTPQTTYTTSAGNVAWTNPIVLDSAGRVPNSGEIWLTNDVSYKFVLKDSNDVLIATWDNVSNGASATDISYTPAGTGAITTTVQAELRKTFRTSDYDTFANAITAANGKTLILDSSISISDNLTITNTISLVAENTCTITVASGKKLIINAPFSAGLFKVFDGAGTVVFGNGATDAVYPEWWGAVADGTTNCSPAVTAAILSLLDVDSKAITLNWASGHYYLDSQVPINFTNYGNSAGIRFQGTTALSNYNQKGTVITGKSAIDSMFVFKADTLGTTYFYSFECQNISFISGSLGTTGPKSALLSLGGGQSSRPFIVKNCYFKGFLAAIKSDMTGTGLATGICNVDISNNFFINNTYAVHGVGTDSIVGLNFSNNSAGTGGRISATIGSYYSIVQNILESNNDTITISGGPHNGEICRNYFEANTGYLINVSSTVPYSTVSIHDNYVTNCSGTSIVLSGIQANAIQDLEWTGVNTRIGNLYGKSTLNTQEKIYLTDVSASSMYVGLALSSVSLNSSLPPLTITAGGWVSMGGTAQNTPITGGAVDVATINGSGTYKLSSIDVLANEWVVFSALARRRAGSGALYVDVLNNAQTASIGTSNTNAVAVGTGIGEWYYVLVAVKVSANSSGSLYFNWNTEAGTQIDVTETYAYLAGGLTLSTPIYAFLPSQ